MWRPAQRELTRPAPTATAILVRRSHCPATRPCTLLSDALPGGPTAPSTRGSLASRHPLNALPHYPAHCRLLQLTACTARTFVLPPLLKLIRL